MGRVLALSRIDRPCSGRSFQPSTEKTVNAHLKSYLFFLGFLVATKAIVVPLAQNMGIPYVKDL